MSTYVVFPPAEKFPSQSCIFAPINPLSTGEMDRNRSKPGAHDHKIDFTAWMDGRRTHWICIKLGALFCAVFILQLIPQSFVETFEKLAAGNTAIDHRHHIHHGPCYCYNTSLDQPTPKHISYNSSSAPSSSSSPSPPPSSSSSSSLLVPSPSLSPSEPGS